MPIPELLAGLLRTDPGRPRITCYDDRNGPTRGERVELSAKVLTNWVSKAANALQEEWDLGPGGVVALRLPPHWRALYWALATWSVGATLALNEAPDADLTVAGDLALLPPDGPGVFVTEAALARGSGAPVPTGVLDEAAQLATFADVFTAWDAPDPADPALRTRAGATAYGDLVAHPDWPAATRASSHTADTGTFLRQTLALYALGGSLVLTLGGEPPTGRLDAEGVTLQL